MIERQAHVEGRKHYLEDARSPLCVTYADMSSIEGQWSTILDSQPDAGRFTVMIDVCDPVLYAATLVSVVAAGHRAIPINPSLENSQIGDIVTMLEGVTPLLVTDHQRSHIPGASVLAVDTTQMVPDADETAAALSSATRDDTGSSGTGANSDGQGSLLLFTSGSTGTPKGVELFEPQLTLVSSQISSHHGLTREDRGFCPLPLFHINAEVVGLLATLQAGATIILDHGFHRTGFWNLLNERHVTWLNAVPAILAVLATSGPIEAPPSLRFIRSASAPLPDRIRQAFTGIPFIISWGMTEGASQITATNPVIDCPPHCVGRPLGCEISVRDNATGKPVPPGHTGVFWLRGPGVVTRYFHGAASNRFDSSGWLNTGDAGMVDSDGEVYLMSRTDDVINRGGEKVYPAEIEEWLLGDPRVREAVVVGRADDILTQTPVAYVIPASPDHTPNDDATLIHDITQHCQDLPKSKRPVEIHVVSDLPRTATGKIKRAQIRSMLSQ